MAKEYKFPLIFECHNCGSLDTVSRLIAPNNPAFTYMRREPKPLKDLRLAVLTVDMMVRYFDQCANCGVERCTKIEIQKNLPITAIPKDKFTKPSN